MPAMQLRASTKFIKLGYVLCLMLALAIAVYLKSTGPTDDHFWWLLIVPAFLAMIVVTRHIERMRMKLEVLGDRLRFQSGFLSRTTRTMELVKVQDVRVDQTFGQRLAGLGDLSFETAGEASRIVMRSIDRPQIAADHILELARTQRLRPDAGHAASQSTP
jgi:uncharacterized membrane protein YdbT with pleckstrin-like domain